MKDTYRIGDIARFLGISTESIRFYEREGLVHPIKDETNGYRGYTAENIYELLDVIFYRKIDLHIEEIREILQSDGASQLRKFKARKELEIQHKIWQQKMLLTKLDLLEDTYQTIDNYLDRCAIRPLPSYIILREWLEGKTPEKISQLDMSGEEFDFCSFGGVPEKRNGVWHISRRMILIKRKLAVSAGLAEKFSEKPVIESRRGGYFVFRSGEEHDLFNACDQLISWLTQEGYRSVGSMVFNHLISTGSSHQPENYLELFVPVV